LQQLGCKIIVIDSGSTDQTIQIAQSYGAQVIEHPWEGFGKQKQYIERTLPKGWLLCLDADEWLNSKAVQSIRQLFQKGKIDKKAYILYRNDVYIGKIKNRALLKRHPFLRLYNSHHVGHDDAIVVESVNYDLKKAGKIKGRVFHIAVRSIWHVAQKENNYSNLEQSRISKSTQELSWRIFVEMPIFFIKYYVVRFAILGGWQGFCYAMIYSFARFHRIAKLLEKNEEWRQ